MPPSRSRGASHFLVEAAPADFTSVERWFCSRIGGNIPRPRRFYTGGAMVEDLDVSRRFLMCSLFPLTGRIWFLREEQSSLHRPEVGGGAGTRKGVTGAESRLHRRKVGGGPEFLSLQETYPSGEPHLAPEGGSGQTLSARAVRPHPHWGWGNGRSGGLDGTRLRARSRLHGCARSRFGSYARGGCEFTAFGGLGPRPPAWRVGSGPLPTARSR